MSKLPKSLTALAAVLLQMPQHIAPVLDLIPHVPAHINGRLLLDRQGDAIAGPSVQFHDLLFEEFVFRADDQAGKIRFALQVIDDPRRNELRLQVVGRNPDPDHGRDRDDDTGRDQKVSMLHIDTWLR